MRSIVRRSSLDDGLADVVAAQHADECIEHIVEALGHSLGVFELSVANQLHVLLDSLEPPVHPAPDEESFDLQLLEDDGRLKERTPRQDSRIIVVGRDAAAYRDSARNIHLVYDSARNVSAHLLKIARYDIEPIVGYIKLTDYRSTIVARTLSK